MGAVQNINYSTGLKYCIPPEQQSYLLEQISTKNGFQKNSNGFRTPQNMANNLKCKQTIDANFLAFAQKVSIIGNNFFSEEGQCTIT